ncbi:vitamin K epoxide reductase family protein [Candidatus Gottesmanbacteria bacterium]|nr:vitamin K epoxide reductase family protein [Candidatus Gottesmanbacteria bacterium]
MKDKRLMLLNRVIFVLSLIGVAIAIYVTQSFLRHSPIVCVNTGCELVRKSAASYIFGIPVPMFGLAGYSMLAILAFLRTTKLKSLNSKLLLNLMLAIATFGVLFVSWFTYTELFVIKAVCTWCAISAVNMIVIFIMVIKSYTSYSKA